MANTEAGDFNCGNNVSDDCMTVSDDDDDHRPTWWFPVERSKLNSHWHNLWSCREAEWDKHISYQLNCHGPYLDLHPCLYISYPPMS